MKGWVVDPPPGDGGGSRWIYRPTWRDVSLRIIKTKTGWLVRWHGPAPDCELIEEMLPDALTLEEAQAMALAAWRMR